MALVVPNEGELELLKKLLINATDSENYLVRLYKNDPTLGNGTVLADFTQTTFTSYAEKTMVRGVAGNCWATPSTVSDKAQSSGTVQSWTCGATGDTIVGYYVVGSSSNKVLWAEKFSTARVLASGDILNLTPQFTLNSAN
jgi:hypothetical protein